MTAAVITCIVTSVADITATGLRKRTERHSPWRSPMRYFVTGASGHIGSALVPELIGAGHQVVGLARSDESAAALAAQGVGVLRGDLDDLDGLARAAAASDGVAHLAYKHDLAFGPDPDGFVKA
ncbi:MAG TPA: NAD-dependent epimerase/dehydratase family protein, partial [Acidimicrobiales bacterium]